MINQNIQLPRTLKVNIVAPPSRGKTSLMRLMAAQLKLIHQADVETVDEFAKEKCFMGIDLFTQSEDMKKEELLEQNRREEIFKNKVDILLTSSPLMIVGFYLEKPEYVNKAKELTSQNCHEIYFYLTKDQKFGYESNGRELWTEEKTSQLELKMINYCNSHNLDLHFLHGSPEERVNQMINKVLEITAHKKSNNVESNLIINNG